MGLVLRPEYRHVKVSSDLAAAINRRFFFFDGTTRRGVAKAVEDDYVELELHPRYEGALGRYIAVVKAIGIKEREANSQARLKKLATMLADPTTAADAALQLEALGESAIPTLTAATRSENPELRFYAAEALGYLDREEAIVPLEDAIANESAFRYPALASLRGLEHPTVVEALVRLFDQSQHRDALWGIRRPPQTRRLRDRADSPKNGRRDEFLSNRFRRFSRDRFLDA